jgi:DNA-binding CsgD family transcriptional regulator
MSTQAIIDGRVGENGHDLRATLAASESPALITDAVGRILFWNRAAERVLDRTSSQSLGRRCCDVLAGRDVHGNRYCHEGCAVMSMARRGEAIHGFELLVGAPPRPEQAFHVTILKVQDERPGDFRLVHFLEPIDRASRLARALERLGARPSADLPRDSRRAAIVAALAEPPLTQRESEILCFAAAGLQNKEIAGKLRISVATVRNHVHNLLEKLEVHSKLEAVSLAFRKGWVSDGKSVLPGEARAGMISGRRRD